MPFEVGRRTRDLPGAAKFHLHDRHTNAKVRFPRTTFHASKLCIELLYRRMRTQQYFNRYIAIEFNKQIQCNSKTDLGTIGLF